MLCAYLCECQLIDMQHHLCTVCQVGNILMLKYSQRFKAQSFKDLKEFADELWEKLS
eukprot:m.59230 g.59230  ORF g.59230 m.59230 type:complete len:57 (+) comp11313_c0_seq5:640-810(+)